MEYEKNEQVIFIKDLLFAALYQWRKVVVFALIFAILLGGVSAVSQYKNAAAEVPQGTIDATTKEYEEKKQKLEESIEDTKKQILAQETYLKESVLMNADPYNLYQANLLLAIDVPETSQNASTILRAYLLYLNGKDFIEDAVKALGISKNVLSELIQTERDEENPRSVLVTVSYSDEKGANQLLMLVMNHMEQAKSIICENVGEHTMGMVLNSVYSFVHDPLKDKQQQAQNNLDTLKDSLGTMEEELEGLTKPTFESQEISEKKILIFAVLGGILGAVLAAGFACFIHIIGGKVYSARVLRNKTGLNALGIIPGDEKNVIDQWLGKLEGRITDEKHVQVALSTVCNYCGEGEKLLVAGDCEELPLFIANTLKNMGVQIVAIGNLLKDADTVAQLPKCDAVLLVEKCGESRYANIMQTLALVEDQKKPVIGFVLKEK